MESGAEAILVREGEVMVKTRVPKAYRLLALDNKLRKQRTRAESRILAKLNDAKFPAPKLIAADEKEMVIRMEFLEGQKLRDELSAENYIGYAKQVGTLLRKMHKLDVIHSDLTTSNMIVRDGDVHFIDFGLSFISERVEDRAVDLHLLHRALDSYHYEFAEEMFTLVLKAYKDEKVLAQLAEVEKRGRYKQGS